MTENQDAGHLYRTVRPTAPDPSLDEQRRRDDPAHGPDNHLALIYESFDEQLASVVPFVRQGLERGERLLYVVDENTESELADAFRAAGIDVDGARESGALTFLSKEDSYGRFGQFDAERMIAYLAETVHEELAGDDFERVRITGEMTWALEEDVETLEALVEYESKVNEFYTDRPVTGLCQYNRSKFDPELLYDIIRSHPHQVYDAGICHNFAYVPPEKFFGAERPTLRADDVVETHLGRIRAQGKLQKREATLDALVASNQHLLDGDGGDILEHTLGTVDQLLDPSLVSVFRYEEGSDDLVPAVIKLGDAPERPSTVSLPDRYRELLWDVYVSGSTRVFEHFQSGHELPELEAVLQSGVAIPIGHHGVLFVASTQAYAFDEFDVQFLSTIAMTAGAALDGHDRERTLEERNEQLQHLSRLNRTIRGIDQAVIRASSREEIERTVCERLTDTDGYRFAWIGSRDPLGQQFAVRAWAGQGEQYLDDVRVRRDGARDTPALSPDDDSTAIVYGPERTALETGETQVASNVFTETTFGAWRTAALKQGFHSCISIPLQQSHTEYGVLTICASEPHTFTGTERDVLTELGSTVAFGIDAVETRAGVHATQSVELGIRITEGPSWVLRLARELGCTVEVETVLPGAEDRTRLFFSASGVPPESVLAFAEESVSVERVRHVADGERGGLFEAVLGGQSIARAVARLNASTHHITADEDGASLVVGVPLSGNTRGFVDSLSRSYPGLDVISVRRVSNPTQTGQSFFAALEELLTPKQLEALEVAYHSGYFEWPRRSAARDIAESLGVSQPTFSGHLRRAEQKLLRELFER